MKRINEYKKLFNVESEIDLKQLKGTYRNLVKEWHPDKFMTGDEKAFEASPTPGRITASADKISSGDDEIV